MDCRSLLLFSHLRRIAGGGARLVAPCVLVAALLSISLPVRGALEVQFIRGDYNGVGGVNITDPIGLLNFLFAGGVPTLCVSSADADASDGVNITDAVYLLNFLFAGGTSPPAPYPDCGVADLDDSLGCGQFDACFPDPLEGIDLVRASFGFLETIAGRGQDASDSNAWDDSFEGGAAVDAELSRPHITLADMDGKLYIADKDAHAIRRVSDNGKITTVAGTGSSGDGVDEPGPATARALDGPNGLWVLADGTFYVLDTGNDKVRRVAPDGTMETLFEVPGLRTGRGLWVADDESLAYVSSRDTLVRWTPEEGTEAFASGFEQLGNLAVDPDAPDSVLVTDRDANRVYRVSADSTTVIAGDGSTSGGGDGQPALSTGLNQVRGVWLVRSHPLLPSGGIFLATQAGNQIWYLHTDGTIHLFVDGATGAHAGDGERFDTPGAKISRVRSVTMDWYGNLLITEHDAGYVRRIWTAGIP